ncbi:MAG: DUF5615 family PIN-like protein [Pirellulales bacterium]
MEDQLRFYIDECLPPQIAVALRSRGVDATAAREVSQLQASDIEQLAFALQNGWVLVTCDADFLVLAQSGAPHAGIVFCSPKLRSIGDLVRKLIALGRRTTAPVMRNAVEFL